MLTRRSQPPLALDPPAVERLRERITRAAGRRGEGDPLLASATCAVPHPGSLRDLVRGARATGGHWSLIEQPERGRRGLLALGAAAILRPDPQRADRFDDLARRWQRVASTALADSSRATPASGLVAVGGLAFAPDGGASPTWAEHGAGDLTVPAVSIAVEGETAHLTVTVAVPPGADVESRLSEAQLTTGMLIPEHAPPADPFLEPPDVSSVLTPRHFTDAVARATRSIRAGELEKIVLAREVDVRADVPWDIPDVLDRLAARFPACFVFGVGRGGATMVGASPELLVRRDGARIDTVALAGSARRSQDPAVDDHLASELLRSTKDRHEHRVVVDRIVRALRPHAHWVTAAREPQVATVANVHHLATPIRAHASDAADLLRIAGALHPTPAVGGEPSAVALPRIGELEGFDRGWYAAPVGWIDRAGDGELFVALRSGVIRETAARLFAGVGVVGDSDPAAELAETELKLGAVLGALLPD